MLKQEEKKDFLPNLGAMVAEAEDCILESYELPHPIATENTKGRGNQMEAINNKIVKETALRQLEIKSTRMKSALEKVNESDFGSSRSCGSAIPFGRLMLLPGSTQCVQFAL